MPQPGKFNPRGEDWLVRSLADLERRMREIKAATMPAGPAAPTQGGVVADVVSEGAKGDGTTNDSAAFQSAIDKAYGAFGLGGTVIVPPLQYHLSDAVQLKSRVRIVGPGAVIRKYNTSAEYSAFEARSNGGSGYGSSVSDVYFDGLTFKGSFTAGAIQSIGVTLHHSDRVTFERCRWTEAINSGHAIDSIGTRGLRVRDCVFEGFNLQSGKDYVEAIQLDYSIASAGGGDAVFDALPTIDVIVESCQFIPLTVGGTTYPAPNPMGQHSRVATRWIDNIKFLNNYVEGCAQPVTTDGFVLICKGWLHFLSARNVEVSGNYFKNVGNRVSTVLRSYPIQTGIPVSQASVNGADSTVGMTEMSMQNLVMERNTFDGFTTDGEENIVDIRGTSEVTARGVRIANNYLKNSRPYSLAANTSADYGSTWVYLQYVTGADLVGNHMDSGRTLLYTYRSSKVTVHGGTLSNLCGHIGRFSASSDITISKVDVDGHGGGWYFYPAGTPEVPCVGVEIDGGSILNGRADAILAGGTRQHITLSAVSEFTIHGVRIPADGNGYTKAISAYNVATAGMVRGNIANGWINDATFVSKGAGSVADVSGNLYA